MILRDVSFQEQFHGGTDDSSGVIAAVDLAQDESALDEGGVLVGERFWILHTCRTSEVAESITILPFVIGSHRMYGIARIREFGRGINELTAVEVGRIEPTVEHVKDCKQGCTRIVVSQFLNGFVEAFHFPFVTLTNRRDE